MAGDYLYPEDTAGEAPSRFEKYLKVFIMIAALCLGGELIWLLGVSPWKALTRIDIFGYEGIAREEILAAAGITARSSFFSVNTASVEKALMEIASLQSVRAFKYFPSRLQIVLEGRRAVASALVEMNGRAVPVMFDSQGVIFEIGRSGESHPETLPLVSGLFIEEPYVGMRLLPMYLPFFNELEKIQLSAPELLEAVSEIKINRKLFDSFDFILYPMHKKIKVRIDELNEELLRYTLLMVDVLSQKESGIDSFDFRSGIASYIPKEASSE